MTLITEAKGKDCELTINGVVAALVDFSLDRKTGTVSQDRIGYEYPRNSPGSSNVSLKLTFLDINPVEMTRAMATGAMASTRTVIAAGDASTNWAKSGTSEAASVITVDTANKKKGTGAILVTNTGDASGNVIEYTASPAVDMTGFHILEAWVRSSVTGASVLSIGFGESAITEQTKALTIQQVNTYQRVTWDISAIADSAKNAVSKVGFTLGSASIGNTVYIDSVNVLKGVAMGTPEYVDVSIRVANPLDDTIYVDYFIPDCFYTDFALASKGGKDKVIETPMTIGIKDASKILEFHSA